MNAVLHCTETGFTSRFEMVLGDPSPYDRPIEENKKSYIKIDGVKNVIGVDDNIFKQRKVEERNGLFA